MYFLARGGYQDENGHEYPIKLCFTYDRRDLNDPTPNLMVVCPAQYWPTDDDPNKDCPKPN